MTIVREGMRKPPSRLIVAFGAGLVAWALALGIWVRDPDSTYPEMLVPAIFIAAFSVVWFIVVSAGTFVMRRLFLDPRTPARSGYTSAVVVATVLGALSAVPVDRDWDDGCNAHSGTVPLLAVPLTINPGYETVPAYRNTQTLVLCR